VCRTRHGKPVATIAARYAAFVTTKGSGACVSTVAQGGLEKYVKPSESVLVPPGVVRDTLTEPTLPAGVTAVSVVEFTTVTDIATTPPIRTVVLWAPTWKPVPTIVMLVPPPIDPLAGLTDTTDGAGT
jgi:hypothetical protein